jgi:hypothetical protein
MERNAIVEDESRNTALKIALEKRSIQTWQFDCCISCRAVTYH